MSGLAAPRQEPFIQMTSSGVLRRRLLQTQLLLHFREDVEKLGIHPCFGNGAGSIVKPDNSSKSEAARDMLSSRGIIVKFTKRDKVARTSRGILIWMRKEDGRVISAWRE